MVEFSGFYKLPMEERIRRIAEHARLSDSEVSLLRGSGALSLESVDRMVENAVGAVHLPLGLGLNFIINGKEYVVPMALEEPSVVAAASHGAKLCLPEGFTASADEPIMTGQIQLVGLKDARGAISSVLAHRDELEKTAKKLLQSMESRGGGFRGISAKQFRTPRGAMAVFYFDVDVRDSMGANTLNTFLEGIAPRVQEYAGEGKVRLRILSNLATKRMARAKAVWKKEVIGPEAVEAVLDAYELACADVYRAATHNKGIMNGIDALALATGNDWRAVEAGAHAYASLKGYTSLTRYGKDSSGSLVGEIELPMALATVGGSIGSNPIAKISLKILNAASARELSMVAACVGLANNFAALRALCVEGIQKGHMELQARNLAMLAGASPTEADEVALQLTKEGAYKLGRAKEILKTIRSKKN
ncbi:MAG: hydroxymethylglutaryl-CoA reductase, degradative [Candidatus ainarchaeum sp.]|nr:hydroxymethylglutaryl-CoA reductase, degradative [Candidatus ainarchaeum sp.]